MKKLFFPLMFFLGTFLFTACSDENSSDNLPQLGENRFGDWLKNRAEFVYTTTTSDSILMRYDLVRPSSNIFRKTVIVFPAGVDITDPATVATFPQKISFVQPGTHFQQPSLFESNNIGMNPREEIYKFDEDFINREWRFTTNRISDQNWAFSANEGLQSILNIRTIEGIFTLDYVINNAEPMQIPRFKINLTSNLSDANGNGTVTAYGTYYVNQQYGLMEASDFLGTYSIARITNNSVPLPNQLPDGGGTTPTEPVDTRFVGKWMLVEATPDDAYRACDFEGWEEYHTDGARTIYDKCLDETSTGTWLVSGDKLIISEGGLAVVYSIISVTADEYVVSTDLFGFGTVTLRFRKI